MWAYVSHHDGFLINSAMEVRNLDVFVCLAFFLSSSCVLRRFWVRLVAQCTRVILKTQLTCLFAHSKGFHFSFFQNGAT